MKDQQIVFATNENSYYQTSRSKYDPSIIQSKRKNVQLSYRVCNQIYKGDSVFLDPQAEAFYNEYMRSKQQSEINKSQKTDDCSQLGQSRNYYQKRDQTLSNFGPLKPYNKENLSHLSNQKGKNRTEGRSKQNKMSLSFCDGTSNRTQRLQRNLFKSEAGQERIEIIVSESQSQGQRVQDSLAQIKRLRKLLKQRQKQLTQVKKELEDTRKRQNKLLYQTKMNNQGPKLHQEHIQLMDNGNRCRKNPKSINQQLGGTAPALMYMTLFMVLLAKQTIGQ